ncbi:MAG: iron-siderophore ABC transporter permease [Pusillimonas sp.]|nr:iron-siderophore ABC transporter permease [Pusillimonas sp.]
MPFTQPSGIRATYRRQQRNKLWLLLCLAFLVLVAAVADLLTGPANFSISDTIKTLFWPAHASGLEATVIWQLRVPQTGMALAVGAALGIAGAEMQTVLDNPLASPFTLGVSSAAALGAALALTFNFVIPGLPAQAGLVGSALIAALACVTLLDRIASRANANANSIVLFGIALIFSFNAVLALMQYLVSASSLQLLIFWMMGSLARSTPSSALMATIVLVVVLLIAMRQAWQLTALRYGDERARTLGVNTRRLRRSSLLRVGVLTAVSVSLTGVIGFIGLVAPHIARTLMGEDHRWYLPASALTGAFLLLCASSLSKVLVSNTLLPVGIVTTIVGVPVFAWIVLRKQS